MLIETLEKNDTQKIIECKTVKNAVIYKSDNIIHCVHYDTIIFAYDLENQICEIQKDLSQTSNRQIRYLVEFFQIPEEKIKNVSKFAKWAFSRRLA